MASEVSDVLSNVASAKKKLQRAISVVPDEEDDYSDGTTSLLSVWSEFRQALRRQCSVECADPHHHDTADEWSDLVNPIPDHKSHIIKSPLANADEKNRNEPLNLIGNRQKVLPDLSKEYPLLTVVSLREIIAGMTDEQFSLLEKGYIREMISLGETIMARTANVE